MTKKKKVYWAVIATQVNRLVIDGDDAHFAVFPTKRSALLYATMCTTWRVIPVYITPVPSKRKTHSQ